MSSSVSLASTDRVLVLAPHPDDESLGAGGLLAHLASVGGLARVIFATNGDNAPWIQRVAERRWRISESDRQRFGARRRAEAVAALEALGFSAEDALFFDRQDQGLTADLMRGDELVVELLARELMSWRPTLLVAPSMRDLHPDHSALAVFAQLAIDRAASAAAPPRVVTYLVHGLKQWRAGSSIVRLTREEQARKRAAILCHASQLAVHRRAYVGMAREIEVFAEGWDGPPHPVRRVDAGGREIQFAVSPHARAGAFGPSRVFLVAQRGSARETLTFPLAAGQSALARPLGGDRVGTVQVAPAGRDRTVRMTFDGLASAQRLFVKLERRFGFFDEAGWIEVARPPALTRPGAAAGGRCANATRAGRHICVVVPCYNVERYCGAVVSGAIAHGAHTVIAVDDGSTDGTRAALVGAAQAGQLHLICFTTNRGKGIALLEAFRHALAHVPFDVLVTMDGDGQHRPADLPNLVCAWRGGHDLVIGERSVTEMPPRRRWGNDFMAAVVRSIYPDCPADSQSGFRAFDRTLIESIVNRVSGARYETELRILLLALAERRRIAAVPIPTLYLDDNRSSHYRPLADSMRIWTALTDACYVDRWTDRRAWRIFGKAVKGLLQPRTDDEMPLDIQSAEDN
jgi:LmbE family N-acetylglucosaminyl deacetylase